MNLFSYIYLLIYILTITFALFPNLVKERVFFIFWFAIILVLSFSLGYRGDAGEYEFIMRDILPQRVVTQAARGDINLNYFSHFKEELIFVINLVPSYTREFIFWYSLRFLYQVTNNIQAVFMIIDSVAFIFLYKGFHLIRDGFFPTQSRKIENRYLLFGCILFFPFLLGLDILYRQFIATAIVICALGYTSQNKLLKGFILFIVAFLVHNTVALLFPLFLYIANKYYSRSLSIVALIAIPFALFFMLKSDSVWLIRSSFEIGEIISYVHFGGLLVILIGIFIFQKFNKNDIFTASATILVCIYSGVVFIASSGASERVAFLIWAILYPLLAYYTEDTFKASKIMRLTFFHISLLPLYIQYSAFFVFRNSFV